MRQTDETNVQLCDEWDSVMYCWKLLIFSIIFLMTISFQVIPGKVLVKLSLFNFKLN